MKAIEVGCAIAFWSVVFGIPLLAVATCVVGASVVLYGG